MPLPAFTEIAGSDEFKALPPDKRKAVADKYWSDFEAENPDAGEFLTGQREVASAYIDARAKRDDAAPVVRRFLDAQVKDLAFSLSAREGMFLGRTDAAGVAAAAAERQQGRTEDDARLEKTRSLFDPDVAEQMAPAWESLRDLAVRGGEFGSPALDSKVSDILPGGQKDVVKGSKEAYAALRNQLAGDFNLEPGEVDDVVKHQLGLQDTPVSRDAFGSTHIKPEVLAQGADAAAAAVKESTLPWSAKEELLADLPDRIGAFQKDAVERVRGNPFLVEQLALGEPGDTAADFQTIVSKLNDTKLKQFGGGAAAGLMESMGIVGPQALGRGMEGIQRALGVDESVIAESKRELGSDNPATGLQILNQLSAEINKAQTHFKGTDMAAYGQGAESVAEALAMGVASGGASVFSPARVAKMGAAGRVLAGGLNTAIANSPMTALAAGKSAVSTYDSAIAAGKSDEEASELAWKSGLIEFGVTTTMSLVGAGGLEAVGEKFTRSALRNAARESAKTGWKAFGGRVIGGITAEQFEEGLITAADAIAVQAKINPKMTVEDLGKALRDTAAVTLAVSGPAVALGELKAKPTHELSNDQLKVAADLTLADAADPLPAGTPEAAVIPQPSVAAPGAPAVEPPGSPEAGTVAPTPNLGETRSNLGVEPAAPESPVVVNEPAAGELSPEETPVVPTADAETRNPVGVTTAAPLAATDAEGAVGEPVTQTPTDETTPVSPEPAAPPATPAAEEAQVPASAAAVGGVTDAEPPKAEYDRMIRETKVNRLKDAKARLKELTALYGPRGDGHPSAKSIGGLNPAATEIRGLRGEIAGLTEELDAGKPKAEKPEMTPLNGVDPKKAREGLIYHASFQGKKAQIGKDRTGRWYVSTGEDIPTENHQTAAKALAAWAEIVSTTTDDTKAADQGVTGGPPVRSDETGRSQAEVRADDAGTTGATSAASSPENAGTGSRDESVTPRPYSPEALKDTFDLSPEQSVAVDALVQAMGLDTSRIQLKRGGVPGAGAMAQNQTDSEYLAAVERGDMEAAQAMVDAAAKAAGYTRRGARSGFYMEGGVPMLPESSANLGSGYYAVLDGTEADVAPYANTPVSRSVIGTGAARRTGEVFIKAETPLELSHPSFVSQEIRDLGRNDDFSAWLDLQAAINMGYAVARGSRPASLESRRGSGVFPNAEGRGEVRDSGKGFSYLFDRGIYDSAIVDWDAAAARGMRAGDSRAGKEIVVANPNQIKSADPVTRRPDGSVIPLSERFNPDSPSILYSGNAQDAKGSFEQLPGTGDILLRGLTNPDVSTAVHELAHAARRTILDRTIPAEARAGITDEDIEITEKWAGAEDGNWTVAAEEKFARGMERYLRDGKAPVAALQGVFDKIGAWLKSIYTKVKGGPLDVKISPEMRAVFDKLVSRNVPQPKAPKPAEPEGPAPVEIRHAYTEARRAELGLPPRKEAPQFTVQGAIDAADAEIARNPNAGRALVTSLQSKPRTLKPEETMLLNHEQVTRELAVERTTAALEGATDENRVKLLGESDLAVQELAELMAVAEATGSLSGASLGARAHAARNRDYSRAYLMATAVRDINGGAPLSAKQRADIDKFVKDLEEAQANIARLEKELAESGKSRSGQIQKKLEKDIEKALATVSTEDKRKALRTKLDAQADAARARIAARGGNLNAGLNPADLADYAVIAASYFRKGLLSVAELTEKMVEAFGEAIRKHMGPIHEAAAKAYLEAAKAIGNAKTPGDVLAGMKPGDLPSSRDIYSLAKAHVITGLRGKDVLDAVTSDLQDVVPGIERSTVATIFTDYGKTIYPSQEEISVQLRNLRAAEQVALKLADVLAGKAPLRSGYQRGDDDPEIRKLKKELNAAMRAAGIKTTSNRQQLKSSLDAARTRMQNEMEDKRKAIADKTPLPGRVPPNYTDAEKAELAVLQAELDAVRKDYDAAFAKPGLSVKQRLQIAEKSLSRRIAEEEKMLAAGITSRQRDSTMGPWSPALAAMQARLDALREQRAAARAALNPKKDEAAAAIEAAEKSLVKSVDRMNDILKTGKLPGPSTDPRPWSPTISTLIAERGRLMDAVKALRKSLAPAPKTKEERAADAAVKALDKAIAELDRRITTGDLTPTPKRADLAGRDPRVRALRLQRNSLNETLKFLRRVTTTAIDPELRRIQQLRRLSIKRSLKWRKRIREKDYEAAPKPDKPDSPALRRAYLREYQLKRKWNEDKIKEQRAARPMWQKGTDFAFDATVTAGRAVMTSIDLGHFGRQLGPMNYARPEIVARNIASLFTFTDDKAAMARMKIEGRTDAERARFKRAMDAKLGITQIGPNHGLNEMEEMFRSYVARAIPGVKQSEFAYVTNINAVRYDYFNTLADKLMIQDKAALKELANHVGNFTGRGSLDIRVFNKSMNLENAAQALAALLFSPKYWSSRLRIAANAFVIVPLDVVTGFKLRKREIREARKLIAVEYARLATGVSLFYGLLALYAAMRGWDDDEEKAVFKVGKDPSSSDFGKLVFKNGTRQDPMAGISQNLVFLNRMITGKTTNLKGEVTDLDTDPNASRLDVAMRMGRTKLAPLPGSIVNIWAKTDMGYDPTRIEKEIVGQFMPISVNETVSGYKELGFQWGTAAGISNFFGGGVATYGEGIEDSDLREDIFTGLYWLSDGKYGFPESRYEKSKTGAPKLPKPPALPKLPSY